MEKSAKNKFSKIFAKFESEVKRNKSQTVEPIVEEVVEEEVQLSEKEERGLDLFSNLMESLSDDNKETKESEIQDDPSDDVTSDVGEWIKKDIDKNDKKVEALGELFAPLLPKEEENIEPVIEESEIPDELLKEFQEKPVQPKKSRPIKKAMIRTINDLKKNACSGIQVPKRLIPKEYIQKFGINNLWKYDLPNAWRLLYTVTAENEVELISAILEWFNHKDYEKKMKN